LEFIGGGSDFHDARCRPNLFPILMNDARPAIHCDFRAWDVVLGLFRAPEANVDAGNPIRIGRNTGDPADRAPR
jgi:hypothetical protein